MLSSTLVAELPDFRRPVRGSSHSPVELAKSVTVLMCSNMEDFSEEQLAV